MRNSGIRLAVIVFLLASVSMAKAAKKEPGITLLWPNETDSTLKITFSIFELMGEYGGQKSYGAQVTAENMTNKAIPRASFTVYLFDKSQVRIGEGTLNVRDVPPGQAVRVPFQFYSVGAPKTLQLVARTSAGGNPNSLKLVPLRVLSVPPGASIKVDGKDAGVTPKVVELNVGTHTIDFAKEGYATGSTPVDINADEMPGGSITLELGGLTTDTIQLRDGSVVTGDLISLSLTGAIVRVNGQDQTIERNRIKKMFLVERQVIQQTVQQQAPQK